MYIHVVLGWLVYLPSSPAGMVHVRHSEKLGVLQRAQYEHIVALEHNIFYVCGKAGHNFFHVHAYM